MSTDAAARLLAIHPDTRMVGIEEAEYWNLDS